MELSIEEMIDIMFELLSSGVAIVLIQMFINMSQITTFMERLM